MKQFCCRIAPVALLAIILAVTGGCTNKFRAKHAYRAADRDFAEENYDKAEAEYKDVLHLMGMNPAAIGQLGRIYAKEGRILQARACLLKSVELAPKSLTFQLALGQVDLAARDSTNAATLAARVLTMEPTNEEAIVLFANSYYPVRLARQQLDSISGVSDNASYPLAAGIISLRAQKNDEALKDLHQAISANPKSAEAYFALAEFYALQKNALETSNALKTAAELAPLRSVIRIRYIDYLIQNNSIDDAHKMLDEITSKAPDYIPAWVSKMNLALAEKKLDDAEMCAETILARDDKNFEALAGRGTVSLGKGDAEKAIQQFDEMTAIYKKSPQIRYQLAVAYLNAHDKVKGIANLQEALRLDPGYGQAVLLLAQLEIRGGDSAAAADLLTRFLKKQPGLLQGYLLLADAYLAQQEPDPALAVYRQLTELAPKNPQIPMMMGIVLGEQGKHSQARNAFEKSLQIAPDFLPVVQQLIELDLAEAKYKDATAVVQEQMKRNPKAAEPWELLARIDMARTNTTQAADDLLRAINLNPDLPNPYLLLAQVYVSTKAYEPALAKLNDLVSRTNDTAGYLQIGAIQEQLKKFDLARDAYEKVLTFNPKSIPALNNLAYIYAVYLDKMDRAYDLAQKARELMPYNPNVGDTLGWVLFKKGDYPHALTILEDAVEKMPNDAEIQFHVGMAHYMMGEEDAARVALQRALASSLDFPNKDDAKSSLDVLNMDTSGANAAALARLEKALAQHPDDPVILNRIGALQERAGAADKAAETYETALKQNPDAFLVMAKLARLYGGPLDKPEKAMSLATQAHKLAPDSAEVSGVLGHLVYQRGDFVWALSLLENAADRLPNRPDLLYDVAWAYYAVGRMSDAVSAMQNALQTGVDFPGSKEARRFVALVNAVNNPTQAEAAEAAKILQTEPQYVPALMIAGLAAENARNFNAAHDAYSKALSALPMFTPAARQLAILDASYFTDDAQAYKAAEQARTAYPDDPAVARSLGILSYFQSNYGRSAELLQEGIDSGHPDGDMYYYLGMDDYRLKQTQDSKKALQRALAMNLPEKQATEAKRVLAELK